MGLSFQYPHPPHSPLPTTFITRHSRLPVSLVTVSSPASKQPMSPRKQEGTRPTVRCGALQLRCAILNGNKSPINWLFMLLEAALSAETQNAAMLVFSRRLCKEVAIKLVAEFADFFFSPNGGCRHFGLKMC